MSVVEAPASPVHQDEPPDRRSSWRRVVRWFGYLCLMGAAGFAGYVSWLLWGTGLETQRAQDTLRAGFIRTIDEQPPPRSPVIQLPGSAYAQIQIPSIDVDYIVVEGTDYQTLKKGPGHYVDTADPWEEKGRVGIAGHRTTYLHPFLELDRVKLGDEIVLRTKFGTFTYQVTRNFVIPSAGSGRVLSEPGRPSLVLTTCHPRYSSAERLIVIARLTGSPSG